MLVLMLVIFNLTVPADLIFWRGRVTHWGILNAVAGYEAAGAEQWSLSLSRRAGTEWLNLLGQDGVRLNLNSDGLIWALFGA